jgi:hypothetical protein
MADQLLNRRQLLVGASAGAVGIGAVALSPMTALASGGSGLVGTWDVQITDHTPLVPVTFEGATTFIPGGGVVTMDSSSPSTGVGSWAMDDASEFNARFMQFNFNPPGPAKAVVTIHGRLAANSIRGTFTLKIYDLMGHFLGTGHGTFTGKRFAA